MSSCNPPSEPTEEVNQGPEEIGLDDAQVCDVDRLLAALMAGYKWLEGQVPLVNSLNVFPVPDGDTGTNMFLTMKAALEETKGKSFDSVSELARTVAHGALMGARGNSGVILSQVLRGFARGLDDLKVCNTEQAAKALIEAATTAYKGVMKPVEGTILTVVRESAQAGASAVEQGMPIKEWLHVAYSEAKRSLARTPNLLPVLAEAGVVDAGGQGYTFLLEGVVRYLNGEKMQLANKQEISIEHVHISEATYNYDTQFIIKGHNLNVESLRAGIASFGDSVLVVGDGDAVKVHVHSDNPGEVLSYGIAQGQLTAVIIENMQEQFEQFKVANSVPEVARPITVPAAATGEIGIVAVASGAGLARVFESLGAGFVVPGGQTMNPSTQDLLQAVDSLKQEKVIILPNNSNIILTAEQAQALSQRQAVVVPTRTIPQGIAALLAFNYQASLEDNTDAMAEASQHVQTVEVTRAVRSVQVNGLKVHEGQTIGLLNDQLVSAGEDAQSVVCEVIQRHLDISAYEIVTIYYGEDTSAEQAAGLAESIRGKYPTLEVEVLDGGQAHYDYIISIE
ncbi:MAG: DAK2 domain-containing protein [Chloroflexi bacterium]|nr:DAK2 domain-containing protein [Chloroflexota bacterium]